MSKVSDFPFSVENPLVALIEAIERQIKENAARGLNKFLLPLECYGSPLMRIPRLERYIQSRGLSIVYTPELTCMCGETHCGYEIWW